MEILLDTKILQIGFQKKKSLENRYEIKIISPSAMYYEPLSYIKLMLNIQRNIRKLINGETENLRYLKYVRFLDKQSFISKYPYSKSYFNLPPSLPSSLQPSLPSSLPPSLQFSLSSFLLSSLSLIPPKSSISQTENQSYSNILKNIKIPVNETILVPNKTNEGFNVIIYSSDISIVDIKNSTNANFPFYFLDAKKIGSIKLTIRNNRDENDIYKNFEEAFCVEVINRSSSSSAPPPPSSYSYAYIFPPPPPTKVRVALVMPVSVLKSHLSSFLERIFFCKISTYKSEVYKEFINDIWINRLSKSKEDLINEEMVINSLTLADVATAYAIVYKAIRNSEFYHGECYLLNHDIIRPLNEAMVSFIFILSLAHITEGNVITENDTFSVIINKLEKKYEKNAFIPVEETKINAFEFIDNVIISEDQLHRVEQEYNSHSREE